ncbi:MAG TPA: TolC family protein [Vicinamibacteria bacterium]|nr:TolC family protein [Vicinamibacteria bacterium]
MRAVVSLWALLAVSPLARAQEEPLGLSLPALVREAVEHNPEVQMAARLLEARRARVPQAAALPDPMLIYGVMNEGRPVPLETLGEAGFSEVYLGVSQELPFPGKRRLRREAAGEEAEAAEWALEGVRRRVAADVAEAYYDLYAVHAGLDVVGESMRLLERLIGAAHARLSVGRTSQQDVLDAEVELSRLEERRTELARRRAVLEARLRSLLDRGNGPPFGRPPAITQTPIPGPLDELLRQAEEQSPALRESARRVAQGERLVDLARRDHKPDFSVNFTYHNRGGLDPWYSFGGTLTIPNVHGRQKRALEEAVASLGGARGGADQARAEVRYAVTESYQMAATAERLLRLYGEGILMQSRLSLDSAQAQYQVGKIEFVTLITSWRRLLEYELTYQEQLAAHEKALARLAVHLGPGPGPKR